MNKELKRSFNKRNNKILFRIITPCFIVFGLVMDILILFTNSNPTMDKKLALLYYSIYLITGIINLIWCKLTNKIEKLQSFSIQPLHFNLLIIIFNILYIFHFGSHLNALLIFVSIEIMVPILFYIEPVYYSFLSVSTVVCMVAGSNIELPTASIINIFILVWTIFVMSMTRWNSTKKEHLHEQQQEEYIHYVKREIEQAKIVQKSFFKHHDDDYRDWEVSYYSKAMAGVSGDFFDIYHREEILDGISIFDVSGHGIASGLVTMLVKNIIINEFYRKQKQTLQTIVDSINTRVIEEKGDIENYLTGILARINGNTVEFVSAGHPLPIFYSAKSNTADYIQNDGQITYGAIGMGAIPVSFGHYSKEFEKGDELILFTDGVIDIENTEKENLGKERFLQIVQDNISHSFETHVKDMVSDIKTFANGRSQTDDITIIVLRRK